jgi:ATP-dependent Zn protease
MDTRKSASHFVREKNDEPITTTTATAANNINMVDIELAEIKDESDYIEEQRNRPHATTKSVVFTIIALVTCFCLFSLMGWFLINAASIESFRKDCTAKGGYFELVEASPYLESFLEGRRGSCEGVDGAR